jgi:enoyl-CoA hydratase/carnithine racemase
MEFKTLRIDIADHIAWLRLNRPDKANAFSMDMWDELPKATAWLDEQTAVRAVVLCGEGKHFTAGIDMQALMTVGQKVMGNKGCPARGREDVLKFIRHAQDGFSSIEKLRMPVIAAVHGACVGAGVDLIAACDLRYSTVDARFCIKEVDLAVTADVGTLQRLRHVIGLPLLTELSYTAETFDGRRAEQIGLVGRAYATREELMAEAEQMARTIASKSPITVRGIKRNLLWSRDHTVQDGLEMVATWNAAMLISDDAGEAMAAQMQKRPAKFAD